MTDQEVLSKYIPLHKEFKMIEKIHLDLISTAKNNLYKELITSVTSLKVGEIVDVEGMYFRHYIENFSITMSDKEPSFIEVRLKLRQLDKSRKFTTHEHEVVIFTTRLRSVWPIANVTLSQSQKYTK